MIPSTLLRCSCGVCARGCGCPGEAHLPFCLRISGLTDNEICPLSQLNQVYNLGNIPPMTPRPLTLAYQGANGTALPLADSGTRWGALTGELACYIEDDYGIGGQVGVILNALSGGLCNFAPAIRVAILKPVADPTTTELHLFLSHNNGFGDTTPLVHAKVVLTPLPIDCADTDWLPMEILSASDPGMGILLSSIALDIRLGAQADCYYYYYPGLPNCCEGVAIPALLYLTATKNGSPFVTDVPLDDQVPGAGFLYYKSAGNTEDFGCVVVSNVASVNLTDSPSPNIPVTIESCEPFLATGSRTVSGNLYEVVITE